jgi:hypothetical protein
MTLMEKVGLVALRPLHSRFSGLATKYHHPGVASGMIILSILNMCLSNSLDGAKKDQFEIQ